MNRSQPRDAAGLFDIKLFGTPDISLIPDTLDQLFEAGRESISCHVKSVFPNAVSWTSDAQQWDSDYLFNLTLTVQFPDGGTDELDLVGSRPELTLHELSILRPLEARAQFSGRI